MTKAEFEKDYSADRPIEPYSDDSNPNDWANIAHYAEENLEKTFEQIENLEKENAELKEKLEHRNCVDCSNHGSNIKLIKAKEIIEELLSSCFGYNSKTVNYEVKAKAEEFLKECGE